MSRTSLTCAGDLSQASGASGLVGETQASAGSGLGEVARLPCNIGGGARVAWGIFGRHILKKERQ